MAKMIPKIDPTTIDNKGEKSFYESASLLSDQYTIFYGYKYLQELSNHLVREADFIIIHPHHGFIIVEVKQGDIAFHQGQWHEIKHGGYLPLHKDPVEQARSAMFHILHDYRSQNHNQDFPLQFKYAICFPECTTIAGSLPADLLAESVWIKQNLLNLESTIQSLLKSSSPQKSNNAGEALIKMLSPHYKLFSSLKDQIESFAQFTKRTLTDEQERIIDETLLDKRKLFLGTAGTGKTFIAIEKARRSVLEGKKVLLTCFNIHLANWMQTQLVNLNMSIGNFHVFLEKYLQGRQAWTAPDPNEKDVYYQTQLAEQGYDYFTSHKEAEKFDCIIIDEGQDFHENWIICLENMLKEEKGELYIFADPNQNLFDTHDWSILQRYTASTHRLTQNLRNTEQINEWTKPFISGYPTKSKIAGGMQVQAFSWSTPEQQKRLIEKEIGRLISQGISPKNITILSPHRRENGCLKGLDKIKEWPLVDFNSGQYGIQYATIRSFKGLETDILFLIDIKHGNTTCTPADVYVGASRARFLLYVFNHEDWDRPEKSR